MGTLPLAPTDSSIDATWSLRLWDAGSAQLGVGISGEQPRQTQHPGLSTVAVVWRKPESSAGGMATLRQKSTIPVDHLSQRSSAALVNVRLPSATAFRQSARLVGSNSRGGPLLWQPKQAPARRDLFGDLAYDPDLDERMKGKAGPFLRGTLARLSRLPPCGRQAPMRRPGNRGNSNARARRARRMTRPRRSAPHAAQRARARNRPQRPGSRAGSAAARVRRGRSPPPSRRNKR